MSTPTSGWTPYGPTQPLPQQPTASWPTGPAGPPDPHQPWHPPPAKRSKKHLIGYPVTAFVALVIGAAAGGSGGTDPTTPASAADPTAAASAAPAKAAGVTPTPKPAGPKPAAEPAAASGIGKPFRDGKFEFVVTDVRSGVERVGNSTFGHRAQGQFILVGVTVENIGDKPQSLFAENQKLFDARGREFSADSEASIHLPNANTLYEEINPGNRIEGTLVFDVPKGTKAARLELHDSAFSGGVDVRL